MRCACGGDTRVVDSRHADIAGTPAIRRRRACDACGARLTTFESTINPEPFIADLHRRRRAAARRRYEATPPEVRVKTKKREHMRAAARLEAAETGEPVAAVYARWGVD